MSTFPTSRPAYAGFVSGDTLKNDNHGAQHNAEQADISALSDKVGLGASTPASGLVLTGSGTGTSSWSQVNLTTMVSGVLPVANGGTGTTSTTGTGSVVYATSPTTTNQTLAGQPTISDFTNANHDHSSTSKGGQLSSTAFPAGGLNATVLNNPYKFSVYRNAAQNTNANLFQKLNFDTKEFDTGSNFDAVTNFRFTVPVNGFYQLNWQANSSSTTDFCASLYKNGAEFKRGIENLPAGVNSSGGGTLTQAVAGDFFEVFVFCNTTVPFTVSQKNNYFTGILMCLT